MTALYIVIGLVIAFLAILFIRTLQAQPRIQKGLTAEMPKLEADKIAAHLSGAIKYKTVSSYNQDEIDADIFLGFHQYLEATFPKMHQTLKKQTINTYSLIYKWPAEKPTKRPIVLMAHMDVVPADARTNADWTHPPFSGEIADGYVWGRGTLDMKGHLVSVCEAVEHLIKSGFKPGRDIYLAFGHDEECTGKLGSENIVHWFKENDIRPEAVFDEGGVVARGNVLGVDGMLALIGICEKGYADVTLEAKGRGGHASQPPKDTAVSAIAEAVLRLKNNPMKAAMNLPVRQFLNTVRPYMKFPLKMVISNLWCFQPLILKVFANAPLSNALIRTTFAPTMLEGSTASNVLAQRASATVNFRIAPDDNVEKLIAHITKTIKKTGVEISSINAHEPTRISDTNSDAYGALKETILAVMPGLIVSPYLMIGATDSRMYSGIADNIYLFSPFRSMADDLDTIHSTGERITVESLLEGVTFFIRLLENLCERK